jgi:hypothetical protein
MDLRPVQGVNYGHFSILSTVDSLFFNVQLLALLFSEFPLTEDSYDIYYMQVKYVPSCGKEKCMRNVILVVAAVAIIALAVVAVIASKAGSTATSATSIQAGSQQERNYQTVADIDVQVARAQWQTFQMNLRGSI